MIAETTLDSLLTAMECMVKTLSSMTDTMKMHNEAFKVIDERITQLEAICQKKR